MSTLKLATDEILTEDVLKAISSKFGELDAKSLSTDNGLEATKGPFVESYKISYKIS